MSTALSRGPVPHKHVGSWDDAHARERLCATVAEQLAARINESISQRGTAHVVLTGGTVGIELLEFLRDAPVDWAHVHVYFGDERDVPVSDPESNEGQARAALLDHVAIPADNIHGYGLDGSSVDALERAAQRYEELLPERFDVHLLGMGGEGHINSLFPASDALRETTRLCVAVTDSPKPPRRRATLTVPAVMRADSVWIVVHGNDKRDAVEALCDAHASPNTWPVCAARGRIATELWTTRQTLE